MSHRAPASILAIALVTAGCGGSPNNDESSSTTKPKASAPYGLYTRTVSHQDIARTAKLRDEHGPHQQPPPPGRYRLVIARGASQDVIKVTDPSGFTVDMDMVVRNRVLHMTSYVDPGRGSFCGPEIPEQAAYSFDSAAGSLQLRPAKGDPCADRDTMLTGTWAKR